MGRYYNLPIYGRFLEKTGVTTMSTEIMLELIKQMETLAWAIKPANEHTPRFITLALQMRLCLTPDPVGLTPRGTPMPQTAGEWSYLATIYEKGMIEADHKNSELRIKINAMAQKADVSRRTIKYLRELVYDESES